MFLIQSALAFEPQNPNFLGRCILRGKPLQNESLSSDKTEVLAMTFLGAAAN